MVEALGWPLQQARVGGLAESFENWRQLSRAGLTIQAARIVASQDATTSFENTTGSFRAIAERIGVNFGKSNR